jgi:hypothetical protein
MASRSARLLGLFHLRNAEQCNHGEDRGSDLDCPHHDHLGHPCRADRNGDGRDQFRCSPFLPRAGGFPTYHHARIVSGFLIGLPIAVAGGAPISTALLGLDGLFGLKGWQIMLIAEGVPTVLVGLLTLFMLTDRPEEAKFLTDQEKMWLTAKLDDERRAKEGSEDLIFSRVCLT